MKIRVLQYLSKSIAATNMPAYMVQVVFDGIYGKSLYKIIGCIVVNSCVGQTSNLKLRRSTMSFLQWTARMVIISNQREDIAIRSHVAIV